MSLKEMLSSKPATMEEAKASEAKITEAPEAEELAAVIIAPKGSYVAARRSTMIVRADGTKLLAVDGVITPKTEEEKALCSYFEKAGLLIKG